MKKYFGTLVLGFAVTAAILAAFWWATPWFTGSHPPGGLMGMILGMGVIASLSMARRELPPGGIDQ